MAENTRSTMTEKEVDPYPQRTPCPFEGCPTSAEDHHRINRGLVQENGELKRKMSMNQCGHEEIVQVVKMLRRAFHNLGVSVRDDEEWKRYLRGRE